MFKDKKMYTVLRQIIHEENSTLYCSSSLQKTIKYQYLLFNCDIILPDGKENTQNI